MKKFRKTQNRNPDTSWLASKSTLSSNLSFASLPLEIHLLIVEALLEFRDVLALSLTCRFLNYKNCIFLKAFTQANYPDFSVDFSNKNNKLIMEQIRRFYVFRKLNDCQLQNKLISPTAESLCQTKDLNYGIGLTSNWKTLLTAASLGDTETCIYLLEKEKLAIQLGCYAIMSVINIEFLAAFRCRAMHYPIKQINNESFVYQLLFDWPKGKKMFQASKKLGFVHITLRDDENVEIFHSDFLNATVGDTPEALEAPQELLVGAISANYFRVAKKLIENWAIKPTIPVIARLFIQVTRHPPGSQWQTLFQSLVKKLPFASRNYLVEYFELLECQKKGYSLIQEIGYKALIPELELLLELPVTYKTTQADEEELLKANIEFGRIKRLEYLLQVRKIELHWSDDIQFAWNRLYLSDASTAEAMLANWMSLKMISEHKKKEIVRTLIKNGHLKAIMHAYSLNSVALSQYTQKEGINHLIRELTFAEIVNITTQAIQNGYLELLKHMQNSIDIFQKIELHFFIQETIKADRCDTMQWLLKEKFCTTKKSLNIMIWNNIFHKAIEQDRKKLFIAAVYNLGRYQTINFNDTLNIALQHSCVEITKHLIAKQSCENYEALFTQLLDQLLQNHHRVVATDSYKPFYEKWLSLFEMLLKKHNGRFSLRWTKKLYQFIKKCNPQLPIAWMQLLLNLSKQASIDQQKEPRIEENKKEIGITQHDILNLLSKQYKNGFITIDIKFTLLKEWLSFKDSEFNLNSEHKSVIQEMVKDYLFEQEPLYMTDPDNLPLEKTIELIVGILEELPIYHKKIQHIMTALVVKLQRHDLLQQLIDSKVTTAEEISNNHKDIYMGHVLLGNSGKKALYAAENPKISLFHIFHPFKLW